MGYSKMLLLVFLAFINNCNKPKNYYSIDGAWILKKQLDNSSIVEVGFKNTEIIFDQKNSSFSAYVGCNRIGGKIENLKNEKIALSSLFMTKMACPDFIDGLEEKFLENINKINTYRINNENLELLNEKQILLILSKKE